MMQGGKLQGAVAFDVPNGVTDAFGGKTEAWSEVYACRAQWTYGKGGESLKAAREAGRKAYKIRVRSCVATRAITEALRMRDVRRSTVWSIIEVDAITNRAWVYLTVEGPLTSANPTAPEVPPVSTVSLIDALPTSAQGSGTSISASYTAPSGVDRLVILAAHTFEAGVDPVLSASMGGQSMVALGAQLHGGGTTFEQTAFFMLRGADIPAGVQSVELSSPTPVAAMGFEVFTVEGASQSLLPVFVSDPGTATSLITVSPGVAGSFIVAMAFESVGGRLYSWTGATEYGPALTIAGTASMSLATIEDASAAPVSVSFSLDAASSRYGISSLVVAPSYE